MTWVPARLLVSATLNQSSAWVSSEDHVTPQMSSNRNVAVVVA